ncbi:hypothetical protein GGR54DRAFT_633842 [Hypoxylon sp. NC1633]|nr:hypothetical protein GGR54DRAFT_633842 [Hypoxylon sp. NC1633]
MAFASAKFFLIILALKLIADGCCQLAKKLLKRLDDLGLLSVQNDNLFRRGKMAWRWVWNKKEIDEIASRLHYFGSQIALHITYQIKEAQSDQQTRQSSKDDIQAILAKNADVISSIQSLSHDVQDKLEGNYTKLYSSLSNLSAQTSQLQLQVTQETSQATGTILNGIKNLETSLGTMVLKSSQASEAYHFNFTESLARIQVQNSKFQARVSQEVPQAGAFDTASFQNVMRSMLDEYQEKLLSEVRKEFRGTARAEMECLRSQAFGALDGMQSDLQGHTTKTEEKSDNSMEEGYKTTYPSGMREASQKDCQQQKHNTTIALRNHRWIETRFGTISLMIQDKVTFNPGKAPVGVYELTVLFAPSPRWYSKSFALSYRKTTDGRGNPRFGLQFETYRVFDYDHEIEDVITNNDLVSLRSMLSRRVISPSDRMYGRHPLLFRAIHYGHIDMVKTLVQSGADVNATW